MLVVEKIFGIEVKDDSKKEYLCEILSQAHCFDTKNYKVDDNMKCMECVFHNDGGKCDSELCDWLMSEYEEMEDHEDGCEG